MTKEENIKKKKPDYQQHKTVYFNTHNPNDVQLYNYALKVGSRNFSGWVKSLIYQEMTRRNGVPPNPYEYATVHVDIPSVNKTVPVTVHTTENLIESKKGSNEGPKESQFENTVDDLTDDSADEPADDEISAAKAEVSSSEDEVKPVSSRAAFAKSFAAQFKKPEE